MMKYIDKLFSHFKKEVILFEVKTLNEVCKKPLYIESKHDVIVTNGMSAYISKGRKTREGKGT